MLIPRLHLLPGAVLLVFACAAACSYDWTVGRLAARDAGASDATVESSAAEGGPAADAPPPDAGADSGADATVDAADSQAPTCGELEAALLKKRFAAKRCAQGGPACAASVQQDECTCVAYIAEAGSPTANAYATALATYEASDCGPPTYCPSFCNPAPGSCDPYDGGMTYCYP